jgi:menaquinone-dependent protoporphyrinogen IX oxidase
MKAAIVYESLYGHTHAIADAIAQGLERLAEPENFLVDDANQLLPGELDRAREWGRTLGTALSPAP